VRAAADAAARSVSAAWRDAGWGARARYLPGAALEAVEMLLDRIVRAAVAAPSPVRDASEVVGRLESEGRATPVAGPVVLALASRSRRTVRFGRRAVPLAIAVRLGTGLVASFRLGAAELELLASLVVHRMRAAGVPVDARIVQRVTVNAYLSPRRRAGLHLPRRTAAAQLAALWAGRVVAVEPAVGRVRKAAEVVDALDFVLEIDALDA
jgi:hypothetical protein